MPSLAGALAAKVREKRRKHGGETIDDLHATWAAADHATVRALVSKGTKTSVRKLRKLGLLSVGEDAEETAESLRKLAERIDRFHAGGEEGEARARDGDGEEEADGMEGAMVDAGKTYERLVVSLAARSGDEALRGGVVETYGRDGERGLMMEQASSSSEEEDDDDNDDDDDDEEESAEGHEAGGEDDEDQATASTGRRNEARSNGESTAFRVASKSRKTLQKREFFGEHVDLSVDDLESDAVLAARRREMRPAEGEGMKAWEKSRTVMMTSDQSACPAGVSDVLSDYSVKARVATRWKAVHEAVTEQGFGEFVSQKQAVMFGVMSSYMDVLYPLHRYPSEVGAKDPVMDAALLHIINHIAVSGDVIKKNNELADNQDKRKKKKKKKRRDGDGDEDGERDDDDSDDEIVRPQDQGFVRPKVLILAPFRHHAKAIVERLIQLAIQETRTDTVKNKKRFEEEFGVAEEDDVVSERERVALSLKPKQHRALFDGNCDDHFRLGIKITRGSIRLFTDFYDSDVLVASPLGLSTRLEEVKKDEPDPKDFLSSIEISVLYRADALLMQNMAHVLKVYESLNAIPKQQHNSDILRVRDWYLGARAGAYRQNILLSSFESPEINSLFTRYCLNHAGIARWKVAHRGVLGNVSPGMKHVFERLETQAQAQAQAHSASKDEADVRFEHFTSQVWPKIREASCGQLLFVPSYFDLVRVRNFLRKEAASFVVLSEYTTAQDMARARNYFCDGRRRVLLYTERCHFYNRHRIRGIKDIYYYQLPEHQQFYAELANFVDDDAAMATVNVVYTRRDAMRLERIVGTSPAKKMLAKRVRVGRKVAAAAAAAAATFVFVSGST